LSCLANVGATLFIVKIGYCAKIIIINFQSAKLR
jgi:hypothetical protein